MLPKLSLSRAQRRRVLSCTAILALSMALPAPAFGSTETSPRPDSPAAEPGTPIGVVSGGRHTAEMTVLAPELHGAFLSLALPGAGQFYAGNAVKAAVYLGLAGVVWGTIYSSLISQIKPPAPGETRFVTAEASAFAALVGYGGALAVGGASTLDALVEISSRYQAAEEAMVPLAGWQTGPRRAEPRRKGDEE